MIRFYANYWDFYYDTIRVIKIWKTASMIFLSTAAAYSNIYTGIDSLPPHPAIYTPEYTLCSIETFFTAYSKTRK